MRYKWLISSIHNALGRFYLGTHDTHALANKHFNDAFNLAIEIDSRDMKAAALFGLAQCPLTDKEEQDSIQNAKDSLDLLNEIKHYKRKQVEDWLSSKGITCDY